MTAPTIWIDIGPIRRPEGKGTDPQGSGPLALNLSVQTEELCHTAIMSRAGST
jgi:hypothetical protein